ncbi:MAG: ion transporter [Pseudomonadota bacterium]
MTSNLADELIATVIIINAVSIFLATSSYMSEHYGWLLEKIDHYALIFFSIELLIRLYIERIKFFKSGWCLFDTFIVLISIPPQMGYLTTLRALRILRLVRLIRFFPKMQFLIVSMKDAIPGIVSVSFFLMLFFSIFSILAFHLFKGVNEEYFLSISHTLMSMFQLMINDGWAEIVRPLQKTMPYANLFFISYIVVMKFMLLNLFFGLIINSIQHSARAENRKNMKILTTNIEVATELEAKIEVTLEHKVDVLMHEIQTLKSLISNFDKSHKDSH